MSYLTEKQADKLLELAYIGEGEFLLEIGGLCGEVATQCAKRHRFDTKRRDLLESLGALVAMIEFYGHSEPGLYEELERQIKANIQRIKDMAEEHREPSLLKQDDYDDWMG